MILFEYKDGNLYYKNKINSSQYEKCLVNISDIYIYGLPTESRKRLQDIHPDSDQDQ